MISALIYVFAANLFLAGKVKMKTLAAASCPTLLRLHGL